MDEPTLTGRQRFVSILVVAAIAFAYLVVLPIVHPDQTASKADLAKQRAVSNQHYARITAKLDAIDTKVSAHDGTLAAIRAQVDALVRADVPNKGATP